MANVKGKGQRLIPEELLKYLEALKKEYPDAVDIVEANPTLEGGEDSLESVLINGVKYAVGGGSLYEHFIKITNNAVGWSSIVIYNSSSEAFIKSTLLQHIQGIGCTTADNPFPINFIKYGTSSNGYILKGLSYNGGTTAIWVFINTTDFSVSDTTTNLTSITITDTVTEV